MSTKQQCASIAARAKATYTNRNKRKAAAKPKPVFTTGNSVNTDPVKPKQQTRRHRYTEEEWAEIRKRRQTRRAEGRAHNNAQTELDQGGWATMGKAGKTRRVNKSEFGEIRTGLNDIAEANHQKQVAAEKATRPEVFEPVSQPNKRGWAQVVVNTTYARQTKPQVGPQLVLSGKRVTKTNTQPAVRKVRGWVSRVAKVASCSQNQAQAELDKAVADCNGRPGSSRSQAILAAAANRAIGSEMPTLSATITNNAFEVLGEEEDVDTLFPVLGAKKSEPNKTEPKKSEPKKAELVDTTGMDEIDAALALIEAEKRNKIARKVAKAKAKMEQKDKPLAPAPKPKAKAKPTMGAWGTKSAWVKKADGKEVATEKPVMITRKVTFSEPACFTFEQNDIDGQDQEWSENVADREFGDAWFGSEDEEVVDPRTGYPVGMTDWGDQAMWDEDH